MDTALTYPAFDMPRESGFTCRPMRETPTEIWAEILLIALLLERKEREPVPPKNSFVVPHKKEVSEDLHAPLSFLCVCKRLAEVALGHSALWTSVHIPLHSCAPVGDKAIARVLNLSRGRPLTLTVVTHSRSLSSDAWDQVFKEKARIESLTLFCRPYRDLIQTTFALSGLRDWRVLTTLDVHFSPSYGSFGIRVPMVLDLQMLPALETYREHGSWDLRTTVLLPMRTLKTIQLFLPYEYISGQLGLGENVTSLEVIVNDPTRYVDIDTFGIFPDEDHCFPNVRRVKLKHSHCLASLISGKHLESLAYESCNLRPGPLIVLLRDAQFTLRDLYISGTHLWDDPDLRAVIFALDKLEDLCVEIRIDLDLLWDFIDEELAYSVWTEGIREFATGLINVGLAACPALRSVEVRYTVAGVNLQTEEEAWILREMRPFIHRVCEPLALLWLSRTPVVRLAWGVAERQRVIENGGLLWPDKDW